MGWLRRLFSFDGKGTTGNDMREVPVNNPMDVREDGSIRPGDPAYDYMMEVMRSGKASIANQREDGTWETKEL